MATRKQLLSVRLTIIGDEILSGRRADKHFAHAIAFFSDLGVELEQVSYLGDDSRALVEHFRYLRQQKQVSFSFGGIGATVDDRTRQSMARAHDVGMIRHPEAARLIEAQFGSSAYPNRILMADLPDGATLIPNEYNNIPGFSLGDIHCLPGFPEMAWPMMSWVVQNYYTVIDNREHYFCSFIVYDVRESELITLLETVQQQFPRTKISSLPRFPAEGTWQTELGVKGVKEEVLEAVEQLKLALTKRKYELGEL